MYIKTFQIWNKHFHKSSCDAMHHFCLTWAMEWTFVARIKDGKERVEDGGQDSAGGRSGLRIAQCKITSNIQRVNASSVQAHALCVLCWATCATRLMLPCRTNQDSCPQPSLYSRDLWKDKPLTYYVPQAAVNFPKHNRKHIWSCNFTLTPFYWSLSRKV